MDNFHWNDFFYHQVFFPLKWTADRYEWKFMAITTWVFFLLLAFDFITILNFKIWETSTFQRLWMEWGFLSLSLCRLAFISCEIDSLDGLNGFNNHVKTYKLAWCILSSKRISTEWKKNRRKNTTNIKKIVWKWNEKRFNKKKTKPNSLQMEILLNHTQMISKCIDMNEFEFRVATDWLREVFYGCFWIYL